ncbi:MAG: hypothetical protein OCC45_06345 [Desulfotalea sp.]
MKNLFLFLIGFSLVLTIALNPFSVSAKETLFKQEINQINDLVASGKKAVGMFYNAYTDTKVAVCLKDINSCVIQNIPGNNHSLLPDLTLVQFRDPIHQFINYALNRQYADLFKPSILIF